MWVKSVILTFVAALAAAPASLAEEGPAERRVLTIDEQAAWSGVGRLNHSRGGYCSGALIRPDTVLTAAHCVVDEATNRPVPPRDLHFVAGLRAGVYTANRRAIRAEVHPDWAGFQPDDKVYVRGDIAVVTLESPISSIEAKSFSFGPTPLAGDDVTLVSYGRGRDTALSIQEPCQVVDQGLQTISVNCDSVKGTSGSPVFRDGRIVGVVSASDLGEGPDLTYVVLADGAVQELVRGAEVERSKAAPTLKPTFKSAKPGGSRLPGGKRPPSQ